MASDSYPPPLDKLLTRGGPTAPGEKWPDYLQLGFGAAHVQDLIRMATDPALNLADTDSAEVWAPLHAWRTLGQLRASEAVEPLLSLLPEDDDESDDWVTEELPTVFGMIGPAAIPSLGSFLADHTNPGSARGIAAAGLGSIGLEHAGSRSDCVSHLTRELERAAENEESLNGFLLAYLLDLKAVESAPVIERAFALDRVDPSIAGDWPQVQWELGLTDKRPPMGHPFGTAPGVPPLVGIFPASPGKSAKDRARARAKRKQAAKSRMRNRKRK